MSIFNLFKKKKVYHSIPRMYIIVRSDLSETYRMIQGAHALAKFALDYPDEFQKWESNSYNKSRK